MKRHGWSILVMGISLALCLVVLCYVAIVTPTLLVDFGSIYSAGTIVGPELYNLGVQEQAFEAAVGHDLKEPLPYFNPPFFALLFVPLSRLPYRVAYVLWGLVNAGLLAVVFRRLGVSAGGVLLAVYSVPVAVALVQGQASILILWAFTSCYLALRGGEDRRAGMYLAAGLVKPQLLVPTMALLVWKRRWEALRGFAVIAVPLAVLSVALIGVDGATDYVGLLASASRWDGRYGIYNEVTFNWIGTLKRMALTDGPIWSISGWATLALIGASVVLTVREWRGPWHVSPSKWAALILVSLITSQHLYMHDLSLLVLAGALLDSLAAATIGYAATASFFLAGDMPCAQATTFLMALAPIFTSRSLYTILRPIDSANVKRKKAPKTYYS